MSNKVHIGVLGAMPEEIQNSLNFLLNIKENSFGDLKVFTGEWNGKKTTNQRIFLSIAWSGWGKVSAARATTRLIGLDIDGIPKISTLIFNGVAGSAETNINQWDIIIPNELIQHDMDSSPIFDKFVIPSLNKSRLNTNLKLLNWSTNKINELIKKNTNLPFKSVYNGLIATGDSFISNEKFLNELKLKIPDLIGVEMEGASFAQVAIQEKIQWLVIRVISDNAKDGAVDTFQEFLCKYKAYSWTIVNHLLNEWETLL